MKVVIIDDERLARQELKAHLEDFKEIEIIGEFGNADEALDALTNLKPDLIFLDIQMPEKNGFEFLEELETVPEVIFVTAYDEFAIKAFEVNALDYLLKPLDEARLKTAIDKVREHLKESNESDGENRLGENDQVFLKDGDKCWFVKLSEIRLFESEGNYVRVLFRKSKPLILKSLNTLDKRLNEKVFFRASRKHIINLRWIEEIEPWFNGGLLVTLQGGERVEISRRQAVKLKDRMSL